MRNSAYLLCCSSCSYLKTAVMHPTYFFIFFSKPWNHSVLLYRTLFLLSSKDLRTSNISCASQPARKDLWERWSTAGFDGLSHVHLIWWLWGESAQKASSDKTSFTSVQKLTGLGANKWTATNMISMLSFFLFIFIFCGLAWKFLFPWHLQDFSSPGLNRSCPSHLQLLPLQTGQYTSYCCWNCPTATSLLTHVSDFS